MKKPTKKLIVQRWLEKHPNEKFKSFFKELGFENNIDARYFYKVRKEAFPEMQFRLPKADHGSIRLCSGVAKRDVTVTQADQDILLELNDDLGGEHELIRMDKVPVDDELDYLRWKIQGYEWQYRGERRGFAQRLLKEQVEALKSS